MPFGQTTAMASFSTPELQQSFSAWLKGIEDKAQASITEGAKDAASLAAVCWKLTRRVPATSWDGLLLMAK